MTRYRIKTKDGNICGQPLDYLEAKKQQDIFVHNGEFVKVVPVDADGYEVKIEGPAINQVTRETLFFFLEKQGWFPDKPHGVDMTFFKNKFDDWRIVMPSTEFIDILDLLNSFMAEFYPYFEHKGEEDGKERVQKALRYALGIGDQHAL